MGEPSEHTGGEAAGGRGILRWVWIVGVALVLYVLSIGPACKLVTSGVIGPGPVLVAYYPIFAASERWQVVREWYTWYTIVVWQAYNSNT